MNKLSRFIFILVMLPLFTTGCFPKSSSNNDQIATGVAKTVAAQNEVVPVTGVEAVTPPTAAPTDVPPTSVPIIKPTADFRQASLSQMLGTWKVNRINKSSKGVPWQDVGNLLTFQDDGQMAIEATNGSTGSVKFRLDIKQVMFTFDDGHKEYWNFAFPSGNDSLTLSKQGATERIDLLRVK
jgi:hypothetical protein